MDRRLLHKIAVVAGGLVVIGGAIVVLRDPDSGESAEPAPLPPPQTSVRAFADDSVVVPQRGERPKPPQRLQIRQFEHRLVIGWGQRHIGVPEPDDAAGYEVRWGQGSRFTRSRFVAEPAIQLDGLDNDIQYTIVVRTVDVFGQRSNPARGVGTPSASAPDSTRYTFLDRFDGPVVPDPARWHLVGIGNCTRASRGDGEDNRRMVITAQCGSSGETVALRSRTPIRLRDNNSGELGRFVVQTDRPGQTGELTLDLVPGPADLIGRPPASIGAAGPPGRATVDGSLPPGTIRVQVTGRLPTAGGTSVQVLVAPETPLLGKEIAVTQVPPAEIGMSVRWEVVLRTDGVSVLRDGVVVGGGDVVPSFTEATALIGYTGGEAGVRAAVDLIGFTGAPTAPPPLLPAPRIDFDRVVAAPGTPLQTSTSGRRLGVQGGQLRITLVPQRGRPQTDQFTVDIGGREIPARPAISGQPLVEGVRLPIVADVPPDALLVAPDREAIPIVVRSTATEDGLPTQVLTAELELTGDAPTSPPSRPANPPLSRVTPALATLGAKLLDASGAPIPELQEVPRGRLVLEITLDAAAAQRVSGAIAGLAGVEISMDGKPLAGIPTAADGPAIGGVLRVALNTTELARGGHNLQVTAVGTDLNTAFGISYAPFVLR